MSSIILHNISIEELPDEWTQSFPLTHTFKVTIEPETNIEINATEKTIWDVIEKFRKIADFESMGDVDEIFADVRDRSAGREVELT